MNWQDRIRVDPNVLVGKPVIKGTRIAVEFVVDLLGSGWTTEQVLQEYDHLTIADIQACVSYADDVLKSKRFYLLPHSQPHGCRQFNSLPRAAPRIKSLSPKVAAE